MPSRILALDHGTKRIGVALSDELGWTAQPLETLVRRTLEQDIGHIADLVQIHDVKEVLLGLPLRLNGEEGPAAQSVRQFAERLAKALPVPLVTWDERMTTKAAEDLLIAADMSRKKRKGVVDRVAAALLLQSYLEARASAPTAAVTGQREIEDWDDSTDIDPTEEVSSDRNAARGRRRGGHPHRHSRDPMG